MNLLLLIQIFILTMTTTAVIHDPMNIFCGDLNCYEVLGLNRTAELKDIKRVIPTIYVIIPKNSFSCFEYYRRFVLYH